VIGSLVRRQHRVAIVDVHVDIDREQVCGTFGTMIENVFGEVRGMQSLTLQPSLHVGEGDDHGIDIPFVDTPSQIMNAEMTGIA
jgi:hypothetical protein